ncbi:hypothetical protein OAG68_02055 [bacterium]|nr:hypothetical protein [bacterium]
MAASNGRLIIDPPASGSWNMAVDQALLETAESKGQTTFRIYFWKPATLSLGYFQQYENRQQHLASQSCPLVRRKTGGGAILHDHEVTYSLCVPSSERWSSKNRELYDLVHQSLIDLLADYQIRAHLFGNPNQQSPANTSEDSFLCFERRANGDLIVGDDKVGGSAQRRLRNSLLQHGSILLQRSEFAPELPGIIDLTDGALNTEEFVENWVAKLTGDLDIELHASALTQEESLLAAEFQGFFESTEWNENR